jgi:acylphosphatase
LGSGNLTNGKPGRKSDKPHERRHFAYLRRLGAAAARPQAQAAPWYTGRRNMGQKRIHLIVRGRVQDVFFRASTQREARRLGLTGWVRNRPDGAVELVAEGEEDQVKDLLAWAQHGPSTARVDKVDTRWRSYTGEFADFRIMSE